MAEIVMIPCPFCAGPPVLIYKNLHDGKWSNAIPVPFESDDGHYLEAWVFCHECGCDGPKADDICCPPAPGTYIPRCATRTGAKLFYPAAS